MGMQVEGRMVFHHDGSDITVLASAETETGKRRPKSRPLHQKTLKNSISCTGVGLHCGHKVSMTLHPAEADTGIVFRRTDIPGGGVEIPATWAQVKDSRLCTVIGNDTGVTIGTIEHLMSALSAMDIDNALIEINGPEVPAMDGSAAPFVFLIECAGIATLTAPRKAIRVLKTVSVANGPSVATLAPAAGFVVDVEIDFPVEAIGFQTCAFSVDSATFKDEIARARTFGLIDDIPKMREAGLGLGGSLENAVVVNGAEVLNEDGLRYRNEFVRHKALDAIGDLALAGAPLLGRYTGSRSSHALNTALVTKLLSDRSAYTEVVMTEADLAGAPAAHALDLKASA